MLRPLLAVCLILGPSISHACQGLYTYDFADPGAAPHRDRLHLKYFIGRVVGVKLPAGSAADRSALITFEIIRDYRYPSTSEPVQALARVSSCWWTPEIGYVAKFAVDERKGQPGHLVVTYWAF